jgi:hypothetical protein
MFMVDNSTRGRLGSNKNVGTTSNVRVSPTEKIISTPRPVIGKAILPQPCENGNQRILGGSDLRFVTLVVPPGFAVGDVQVDFPFRPKFLSVVACDGAHLNDTLFFHLLPLGKTYNGLAITQTGSENWLPLSPIGSNISKVGAFIRFKNPMPQTVYFDIGHEAGGGVQYFITLAISTDDLELYGSAFPAAGY